MFLTTIAHTGELRVPHPEQEPAGLERLLEEDVIAREAAWRLDLAFTPPPFERTAATWAALMLLRCCQFLVYRDLDAATVRQTLETGLPVPPDRSICYSVDVALCYLPDLFQLARGLSPEDPLVTGMTALAAAWPLSSVGMPTAGELDVSPFIDDPCLRELYVSRVVQKKAIDRARHPVVGRAIREAVGAYPTLAPELMKVVTSEETRDP